MSVYSVCRSARKITDDELKELEMVADNQLAYFSPLKMATQGKQHALGKHNRNVIQKLRDLRDAILAGEHLGKPRGDNVHPQPQGGE